MNRNFMLSISACAATLLFAAVLPLSAQSVAAGPAAAGATGNTPTGAIGNTPTNPGGNTPTNNMGNTPTGAIGNTPTNSTGDTPANNIGGSVTPLTPQGGNTQTIPVSPPTTLPSMVPGTK